MQKKKVALGLSGGVDSAVCASLLKEQGYDVTAVYIECWHEPGCRAEQDKKDALKIALQFNLPFKTLDFKKRYKDKVIEYFFSEYKVGRTPNPDVLCNKEIKFGLFYDWSIKENNFDFIATGHYAGKIMKLVQDDTCYLRTAKDTWKDQTYFLHQITEEQLKHTLFPLQDLSKKQVREKAIELNLHVADKKDSVGICFVGDVDVQKMLKKRFGEKPGDVVDVNGNVIGKHKGLWFYTIGQRSGFTINQSTLVKQSDGSTVTKQNIPPFYVIAKDAEKNQLMVGFGTETLKQNFKVSSLHWINPSTSSGTTQELIETSELLVRIRHTGELLPCEIEKDKNNLKVGLKEAQRGIAPGQFAVFYTPYKNTYICLGGGVIVK